MASTIKVLIVDDSALIRQMLARALSLDPRIEVVGVARDGVEAIEQAVALEPDVITLDVDMPQLSGLEALPFIVRNTKARVLILTSVDDPDVAYQALAAGAVDLIAKPRGGFAASLTDLSEHLVKKIKTAYRVDPAKRTIISAVQAVRLTERDEKPPVATRHTPGELPIVVCIAASTGGPPALETVMAGLAPDLPAAYLIVQHLPAGFSASLVRRLARASALDVVEAQDGAVVLAGTAYVAPHGRHMVVVMEDGELVIRMNDAAHAHGVRPAADPLMASVADALGEACVGVVLTGMGVDGAAGLEAIRLAGGKTIAQDEDTSIVWGMPGAAAKRGAVRYVLPIQMIAAEIRRSVRERVPGDD